MNEETEAMQSPVEALEWRAFRWRANKATRAGQIKGEFTGEEMLRVLDAREALEFELAALRAESLREPTATSG